jgi:hypothetical protein
MHELFEGCPIETLSSGVSVAVVPRGCGPEMPDGVVAQISFNLGLWTTALGLTRDDLVAVTRWTPDDAPKGPGRRVYVLVSLAIGAARGHDFLSVHDLGPDLAAVSLYAGLLPMPDAVCLGGLAAQALYLLRERDGCAS